MPNIGGLEATKRLIQLDMGIKILAVSSMSAQPYPSMLIKAGVNGYITKGTPLDEMIRAVKKSIKAVVILAKMLPNTLLMSYCLIMPIHLLTYLVIVKSR